MRNSKYSTRNSEEEFNYQSRESSFQGRGRSVYNREESLYSRGRSREKERSLHERGRSRPPRSTFSLEGRYNKGRERERSVSEDYGRGKRRKRSESREIRNQEAITELRSVVLDLADKVERLHGNKNRTRLPSVSPDSLSRNTRISRNNLEPMSKDYKKAFRDEVVHILKSLNDSLNLDYKYRWTDIEIHVVQNTIPAIKRVIADRFHYTDTELKRVLQNLHRHQRDAYILSLNPQKKKANKQRTGTNSRRKDKKERRQKGLQRMIDTNDQMLTDLQPSRDLENFIKDLKEIIDNSNYHSDEVSETDDEKVQEEKDKKVRPSRNEDSNHVLHIYDKKWRSQRLRLLLRHADEIGEAAQNVKVVRKRWYDDQLYIDHSKPPQKAPKWTISSSYQSE